MEAAAAKRARAGGGSAPDRLSALPDELLRHVLSFLRSRQAVQTTILSKRWVDLWRSVPAIDLDVSDFPESYDVNWGKMKDFTTNLLMLHSAQFLDEIRLSAGRGFRHNFQIPLIGSAFRCLKTLKLHGVYVDHGFTERLNSGCPVLEDLVLLLCRNHFVAIQSDTLKNLAGGSLAKASISIYDYELSQSAQTILLGGLCNVTILELQGFRAKAFLDKELDFTTFDNLRTLSLNGCLFNLHDACEFTALGRFLQKSPNLEKLTLQDFRVKPDAGPIDFPLLENLRTLFLDTCELRHNFRMLRHFLRRSPNLEKLTVRCCKLPKGANGGKGKANSAKTRFRFRNLVRFQCRKLKSAEVIYKKGNKIQELVSFLLDISDDAPMSTVTLTKA